MTSPSQQVAIVTGASRGIGKQTALRLAARGFRIAIAARTETARAGTPGTLADTLAELQAAGAEAIVVRADMSEQGDLESLVERTLSEFGHVDVLVNNAAYTVGKTLFTHVPNMTRGQWDKHFAVNVTAPLILTQLCWSSMLARGGGVVVNMTSGSAQLTPLATFVDNGLPENGPAYGASKAALNRMTNVIASEGAPHNIAVIAVEPGFVLTETMAATLGPEAVAETTAISTSIPADVIAYLCSCNHPMQYSGQVVQAEDLHRRLGL